MCRRRRQMISLLSRGAGLRIYFLHLSDIIVLSSSSSSSFLAFIPLGFPPCRFHDWVQCCHPPTRGQESLRSPGTEWFFLPGFTTRGWAPVTCVLCSEVGFSWGWEEGTGQPVSVSGASGLPAPPRRPCGLLCSNCACPRMALRAVSPGRDGGVRQFPPDPAAVMCACWPAPSSASSKPRWPHLLLPPPPRPNPGGKTPPQEEATWRGCA